MYEINLDLVKLADANNKKEVMAAWKELISDLQTDTSKIALKTATFYITDNFAKEVLNDKNNNTSHKEAKAYAIKRVLQLHDYEKILLYKHRNSKEEIIEELMKKTIIVRKYVIRSL